MNLTQDKIDQLEHEHNVYIDGDMYTNGERDDEYGWMPIPSEWLTDSEG